MLAAAGFDAQITTTVLWLNDVYGWTSGVCA